MAEPRYDVMLSYCWDQKEIVHRVCDELKSRNINVWIDKEKIRSGTIIYGKMMEGVTNSKIFVPFVSKDYKLSANCEREILFAADKKKHMIPVRMEKPNGEDHAMELIIAGKLYSTFYENENFQDRFDQLYKAIKERLYPNATDGSNDVSEKEEKKTGRKKLAVACEERDHGCDWVGPDHDYEAHEEICEYKMVDCEFPACTFKRQRKYLEEHLASCTEQHLQLVLQNTSKELSQTKTTLEESQARQELLEKNNQFCTEELSKTKTALEESQARQELLDKNNQFCTEELSKTKTALEESQARQDLLEKNNQSYSEELSKTKILQTKQEKKNQIFLNALSETKAALANSQAKQEILEKNNQSLTQEFKIMQNLKEKATRVIDDLERKLHTTETALQKSQTKNQSLQNELSETKVVLESRLNDFETRLKTTEEQLEGKVDQFAITEMLQAHPLRSISETSDQLMYDLYNAPNSQ